MNAEFIAMLDYLEREKGIKREVLVEAVEGALVSAAKKAVDAGRDLRCEIDPKSGEIRAVAKLIVVEKVQNKHDEIALAAARKIRGDVQLGEENDLRRIQGSCRGDCHRNGASF
jgi:N utilization substance protein A